MINHLIVPRCQAQAHEGNGRCQDLHPKLHHDLPLPQPIAGGRRTRQCWRLLQNVESYVASKGQNSTMFHPCNGQDSALMNTNTNQTTRTTAKNNYHRNCNRLGQQRRRQLLQYHSPSYFCGKPLQPLLLISHFFLFFFYYYYYYYHDDDHYYWCYCYGYYCSYYCCWCHYAA